MFMLNIWMFLKNTPLRRQADSNCSNGCCSDKRKEYLLVMWGSLTESEQCQL